MSTSFAKDAVRPGTSETILAVAREILERDGMAAVAMRPVAERVGVTPMAIYRHYADRSSLLNAVADKAFEEVAAQVLALKLKGGVERRLMQVAGVFVETAMRSPHLYELMFLQPREGARVYPRDFKAGRSPTFSPTVEILKQAMRHGELRRDDAVEVAFELSALSHGLIVLYLGKRIERDEKRFRSLYGKSFRRYLRGLRP